MGKAAREKLTACSCENLLERTEDDVNIQGNSGLSLAKKEFQLMKKLATSLLLLAACVAPDWCQAVHYRVYLVGGQSNANGRGDASQLAEPLASPQKDVRFYWHRTQATDNVGHLAEDQWIDLAPGSGHGKTSPVYPKEFGLEICLGRELADAYPDEHIAIIKYSHGGSNLHSQWSENGRMYDTLISTTQAALQALTEAGHTYELCGMSWQQGEADAASEEHADQYEENLTRLIARVRGDLFAGKPLPFVVGGLSDSQDDRITIPGTSWHVVRQAQESVARRLPGVGFVNTDGYSTRVGEAIHFNHDGMIALGKAHAAELLRLETAAGESSTYRPNIVFILADDQGFGDVSALNPESKIPTPNIDRIAHEGMIFSDGHSSSSVCTPTRYSILTGRYHWRTHLQKGVLGGFSQPLISPGRLTVASLLKQYGYMTACIGKWHLGWDWPLKGGGTANDRGNYSEDFQDGWNVDYSGEIRNGPCDHGFDTFFGISASLDMPPYVFVRDRNPTELATVEKAFHRKGPAAVGFEAVDVLPKITQEAIQFIDRNAESKSPFFLYFPLNAPHTPIVPIGEWAGRSKVNKYADFTMQVDWTVGQVLKALDDNNLAKDTLVIFTTDNGCSPAANIPELEAAGHDQNYIYRGHKADIFEGGHRVPFVVRWPEKVKAGSRTDQLVGQIDLLATAAEIVGANIAEDGGEDSISFLPVLLGKATGPIRTSIVSQSIGGQFAVRDGHWKLCLCPGSGGWSEPRPGRVDMASMPPIQLFNLKEDPGERNNLQAENPDRVEKMKELLSRIIENGRSTPGPKLSNDAEIVMIKPIVEPPAEK